MNFTLTKRTSVRILSFMTAIILVVGISLFNYSNKARHAELLLEYQYLKNIDDLGNYLENIEATLTKASYTSTPQAMSEMGAKLWRESGFAKECLSNLPLNYLKLENTYKFLSQVGDYSQSLAKNESISDKDRENLVTFKGYCDDLLQEMFVIQDAVSTGKISFDKIRNGFAEVKQASNVNNNLTEGFMSFEEGFTAYPSLIYDGPFSDHILQKEPEMLKGQAEISRDEARQKAAKALNIDPSSLKDDEDENSNMPSYSFMDNDKNISITKNGGLLSYHIRNRDVNAVSIDDASAIKSAKDFLQNIGIVEITETYFEKKDNIMTINFAGTQNGVVCYTDLIKVSVALDNGEIVRLDSRGYITNQKQRDSLTAKISQNDAQAVINPLLDVQSAKLCLIPSDGLNEVLCYEFTCVSEEGDNVLVYINAENKKEEQLLILNISENGTLAI